MRDVALQNDALCTLADELRARQARVPFEAPARGSSMWPTVWHGDILTVEPAAAAELKVGDVAVYRRGPGDLAVHRLVRTRAGEAGPLLTLRGDGQGQAGETVSADCVIGRVVAVRSPAGRPLWRPPLRGRPLWLLAAIRQIYRVYSRARGWW